MALGYCRDDDNLLVSLYHNLALCYQHIGAPQEAIIYCMQSLKISNTNKVYHLQTIATLNILINLLSNSFGDYEEAVYYIREGT
jgi:tetratricopeptide (TPR) repeat protein